MYDKVKFIKNFSQSLADCGLKAGDAVCVHSEIMRLGFVCKRIYGGFSLDDLIDCIIGVVDTSGTVLFPTFNWDFMKGVAFDYKHTPSMTGALTAAALKRADFKRTRHPAYSFAVWGSGTDALFAYDNKDSFCADSPFGWLHKYGKGLGIDNRDFTFLHYIEQQAGVPQYRFFKDFTAGYTDALGVSAMKTYSQYVRDLNTQIENLMDPLLDDLLEAGDLKRVYFEGKIPIEYFNFSKLFDIGVDDIHHNRARKIAKYIGQ